MRLLQRKAEIMRLKIEIKMDNAAFEDAQGDEAGRILRELADRLEGSGNMGGFATSLRDVNGNNVGSAHVTK